ncbi:hypothetical protein BaRGS_00002884 [Batillaria attramentaria]|uniref:Kazal-like domain-containing protein n=1 Tax=Batillaria attramentaria TaxID=370345 RepID=A0ABD0M1Q8_9CAEN
MASTSLLIAVSVAVLVVSEAAPLTTTTTPECHSHAEATCHNTTTVFTVCMSDGKVYHNACSIMHALCDDHNLRPDYHSSNPACPHAVTRPTTTPLPVTHFETLLYPAIEHGIDDRLAASRDKGVAPKDALPIFSVQDHNHKHYVRNPDCWAADLDLTCISPWNSNGHTRKAGTLVSPRHAVWARHYNIPVNSTLRFVARDGTVVDRRITATRYVDAHGGSGFYGRDNVVGVLDRDVPASISYAKVMPHTLLTMHPPPNVHLPVMSTDFEEKALVTDFFLYSNRSISLRSPYTSSPRHDYYEPKITGDSGNPSFFIIDDELVLLFTFTSGGAGGGTNFIYHYDDINRIMTQLGGGYQLTEVDLSRFLGEGEVLPRIVG